jgi:Amt family ammonium transporter
MAVGLFASDGGLLTTGNAHQLVIQLIGILSAFVWSFGLALLLFYAIRVTVGLRVKAETELAGLDISEHGILAYPEAFVIDTGMPLAGSTMLSGHSKRL